MPTQLPRHDVIVIGARCAGAATARLLAARGHDVVVLDRSDLSREPLSTHGFARGGVVQLSRWGLLDEVLASGAPAIREVTFTFGESVVTSRIKGRAGVDLLVAPRRTALDAILADAATAAGADLRLGTQVTGVLRERGGRVNGVRARTRAGRDLTLLARHVVAADGLRSSTVGQLGAREQQSFTSDAAVFYFYVDQVPWRGYELHVAPGAYAGVFPTHDGQACVWLSRPRRLLDAVRTAGALRTEALVSALESTIPDLGRRVRAGRVVSSVRGIVAPPNYVREAYGPGWALVGDAGYHRDPITGHGITDAFRDAELLAEALHVAITQPLCERDGLAAYEYSRNDALAETFRLTRELSAFPPLPRFVELQIELSEALDREAQQLASRPVPAGLDAAPVA